MKHAGSLSPLCSCTGFFCLLSVEVCTTWRLHDRICCDWFSCKCERFEGIHFQLRAPLCTAMKYLALCRILSTGVTSGQTPIPLSTHRYSIHPFTSVERGKSMHFDEVWIWAGEFEKTYASFVLAAASERCLTVSRSNAAHCLWHGARIMPQPLT